MTKSKENFARLIHKVNAFDPELAQELLTAGYDMVIEQVNKTIESTKQIINDNRK